MVFYRPSWVPSLSDADIPDDTPLSDFLFDDRFRPRKCEDSGQPFVDSVSGSGYSISETRQRIEWLAAGLASKLGIHDISGDVWQRVVGLFAVNNIQNPVLAWAVHRLNGVITPANVAFRASELAHQLKDSGARGLFVSPSGLNTALEAAKLAGIPESNIFLIPVPGDVAAPETDPRRLLDVEDLVAAGRQLPPLPRTKWSKGQGRRQAAYLCYSSGTSGPPKGVMVSHRNIIANIIQMTLYESTFLSRSRPDVILGVLPQSHIYSIILTTHVPVFRGDTVVTMAKFELMSFIQAINKFRMTLLYVVPPILISLVKQGALAQDATTFDLPSVQRLYCGAAPLSEELSSQIRKRYPGVLLGQGYGMTESATVISSHPKDVYDGSSGCIIPGPNVTLGYYKNEAATRDTFANGWLRTGDEVEIRLHPKTKDAHLFVVDRVKELIKVSGFQVAPAELEGHLLAHPMVADCAVIPVPDDRSGEVPKALVVLRKDANVDHQTAEQQLKDWVAQHKSKHKHLRGGVEFLPEVPKSPSGKILRRLLRDRERARLSERKMMAKL
ncbi:hypothetical protein B0T21DRAFT_407489 [Apiosordaria backusii]|uniref:4-coumarate--CoA ligase n=1 Tax=Apiosordaria backusii TaxID=314023 RepID=A0AA40ERX5_9PEZI|nr:hypothetical protein B0T21DRAFT_407489 [Apiosordaria backusii]